MGYANLLYKARLFRVYIRLENAVKSAFYQIVYTDLKAKGR